jgi:uncharacterized protein YfaS (alpha-2-macroglobulin family)
MMRAVIGVFVCAGVTLSAGCAQPVVSSAETNTLYGVLTQNGKPAPGFVVVAVGANGELKGSSETDAKGEYRLDNPPKGSLKFQILPAPPKPPTAVPAKYMVADKNDLSCEYTGGRKQYDIDMK